MIAKVNIVKIVTSADQERHAVRIKRLTDLAFVSKEI